MSKRSRRERKGTSPAIRDVPVARIPHFERAVFGSLLLLVAVPPLFRGLYFPGDQLVGITTAALLFALLVIHRAAGRAGVFASQPLDLAIPALTLAYVLSIAVAVDVREAIQWALVYAAYYFVYWLVSRLGSSSPLAGAPTRPVELVFHALLVSAVVVAAVGLGAASGLITYTGSFSENRIYSTFQYPNTTAAFLSVGIILALNLWGFHEEARAGLVQPRAWWRRGWWPGGAYAFGAAFLLAVTVYTKSRGALLVLGAILVLNLVLAGRGRRFAFCTRTGAAAAGALAALPGAGATVTLGRAWPLLPALLVSAGALLVALPAHHWLAALPQRIRNRVSVALVLAGAGAASLLWMSGFAAIGLERIQTLGMQDYSAWARVRWTIDAWNALRDHPLLGIGGGGWQDIQYGYQHYAYFAKHVHNHFVEIALETGLPGILAFSAIWITAGAAGLRVLRRWPDRRRWLIAAAVTAAFGLGAHSWVDFNLALAAIGITLWALFGTIAAMNRLTRGEPETPASTRQSAALWITAAAALATCILSLRLLMAYRSEQESAALVRRGDVAGGRASLARARKLDRWNALYAASLARLDLSEGRVDDAGASFREAVALKPWNPAVHAGYGDFLLLHGREKEGLDELQKAQALQPYLTERYERLSRAHLEIGGREVQRGNVAAGRPHLEAVLSQGVLLRRRGTTEPEYIRKDPGRRLRVWTPEMAFNEGRASLLLGRPGDAVRALETATHGRSTPPDVWAWLAVAHAQAGNQALAADCRARALAANPALGPLIRAITVYAGKAGDREKAQPHVTPSAADRPGR